ncbi:CHASE2 domain-containing protein [Desulfonatronum parangueonense]
MARRSSGKILLQALITGTGAAILALLPWFFGALDSWEAQTWDIRVVRLAEPGPATGEIALILLDQQSLDWGQEQMGLSWPWPREIHAAIVDFCRRAQAASLTLDILFLEPSAYGVEDDALLARALDDFGSTALAAFLSRAETGGRTTWPENVPRPAWTIDGLDQWLATADPDLFATRISPPLPELARSASTLGNVQQRPDADGVFRRMRPLDFFDTAAVPSLGLAAWLAADPEVHAQLTRHELHLNDKTIPLDPQGTTILRFRGPSGTHAAYSVAAVLQSEIRLREDPAASLELVLDPELLRDKHVFYGFSAPGLFDLRPTPVSGVYPGVEIQATFLDNFLSQDFLRDFPQKLTIALLIGLCLLTALALAVWRSPVTGTLIALVLLLIPIVLAVAAYHLGWWMPLLVQEAGVAAAALLGLLYNYSTEGRQRRFIKNAFQQYLSPQVIEQLIANPEKLRLGGERKILSIFFSDLQGFTTISEKLDPEELTALLNDYLSAMTDIIQEEGGTVDKYEGDAIIAFWNAPLDVPDHALRAVRAALRAQARLAELRPEFRQRTGHDLFMRIGINTGPAVVGNMGSHNRFDYSMLGDAVNLAARLEGVNKQFGTYTMISQATRDAVGGAFSMRELGRVTVVGRTEPVTVYEPLHSKFAETNASRLQDFDQGLKAYYRGDFDEAVRIFSFLAQDDPVAARYLEICRELPQEPPENWNGVWKMASK